MARHISTQFRQEYIQAGENYRSSTSTDDILQINDNIINNNKRKDFASSDLETPLTKISKCKLFLMKLLKYRYMKDFFFYY